MRIVDGGDASVTSAAGGGDQLPWHGHPELESSFSSSSPWSGSHVRTGHHHAKSRVIRGYPPAPNHEKFRRRLQAKKEILRRALAPPARRLTLRWLDFRPTPTRLGIMSKQSPDNISNTQFLDASMMELTT